MSTLRNAAPRRSHRERAQPAARSKWGLLEKHKDYSLRAADYNVKKRKLNQLAQKTRERHPDEFAFGMVKTQKGKHGQRDDTENRLSNEAVKLLKTQDSGYLRGALQRTRKELEKVQEEVGIAEVGVDAKGTIQKGKIVFGDGDIDSPKRRKLNSHVDSDIEIDNDIQAMSSPVTYPIVAPEPHPSPKPVLTKKQVETQASKLAQLKAVRKRRKRLQEVRSAKLDVLRKRQRDIMAAADVLELQRAKMTNSIGGTNRNGVKFKVRERKK